MCVCVWRAAVSCAPVRAAAAAMHPTSLPLLLLLRAARAARAACRALGGAARAIFALEPVRPMTRCLPVLVDTLSISMHLGRGGRGEGAGG